MTNSKYDSRTESDLLNEGYRIAMRYDNAKLFKRHDVYILAEVDDYGRLEVILQLKVPEEKQEPSWKKLWKRR